MPSAKARRAAAKKAAATRAANRAAAPAPVNAVPSPRADATVRGPHRPTLADGKKPHDAVTHADLIQYGIISAPTDDDAKAAEKSAQV